jgi:uncharacterized Tic20 family protein
MILEALAELFFRGIIVPLIQLPGAVLIWALSKGKTFKMVWLEGDDILQFLVGVGIHVLWIGLVLIF